MSDEQNPTAEAQILRLLEIMARLRDPSDGCPWDIQQNFRTIAPYTIEEAYEVAAAIEADDMDELKSELGDLLLQVVFHAQMATEAGSFDFGDVAAGICEKMVRRHPHVFGDAQVSNAAEQTFAWEDHKALERAAASENDRTSVLDGLTLSLPALMRAEKLQKRASRVGFDWSAAAPIFEKIEEEITEIKGEIESGSGHDRLEDEVGDLFFAVVNLARHLGIDPETALRRCNAKFERRFKAIEDALACEDRRPEEVGLDELEILWRAAKSAERAFGHGPQGTESEPAEGE